MMELVFTILFIFTYHISAQDIGDSVSKISYQTTSTKAGGGGTDLTITVNWNGTEFSCLTQPDNTAQDYECTPSSSTGTRNPDIEYYFKIEWNGDPLQITSLTVTDNNDISYSIQQFCVGTPMQCTLDTAEGLSSNSMPSCAQWPSKDSYDNIQLGTDTKFHLLYVDIPIFGTRFANTVIEGGVRPPNLLQFGLTTDDGSVGGNVDISIQWDIALYTCDITPNLVQHEFICNVSTPLFCPGRTVDKNWMSIHDDVEELQIQQISFEDETNRKYAFTEFCNEYAEPFYQGSTCPDSTKVVAPIIYVSGSWFKDLVPFFVPDCIYNYPDTANTEAVEVELGWTPVNTSSTEEFSWNFNDAKYGGPIAPECTGTGKPTFDPTVEPTVEPTIEPTTEPTIEPTVDPTLDPTLDPTIDPTQDPTNDPSRDPTGDPTIDQTTAEPSAPSKDPTFGPTSKEPSKYPTETPTDPPTDDKRLIIPNTVVFWGIIAAVIFLLCCILFFCLQWWRRKKKEEADDSKSGIHAEVIAAAAPKDSSSDEKHHEKQDTYQDFDVGAINTQPSGVTPGDEDDAKEVELQEVNKQPTLDGVIAGGITGGADVEAGNEAVLNMLADGHETGGAEANDANADAGGDGDGGGGGTAIDMNETEDFNFKV